VRPVNSLAAARRAQHPSERGAAGVMDAIRARAGAGVRADAVETGERVVVAAAVAVAVVAAAAANVAEAGALALNATATVPQRPLRHLP
jgi:hypothetical protein